MAGDRPGESQNRPDCDRLPRFLDSLDHKTPRSPLGKRGTSHDRSFVDFAQFIRPPPLSGGLALALPSGRAIASILVGLWLGGAWAACNCAAGVGWGWGQQWRARCTRTHYAGRAARRNQHRRTARVIHRSGSWSPTRSPASTTNGCPASPFATLAPVATTGSQPTGRWRPGSGGSLRWRHEWRRGGLATATRTTH